MAKAIKRYLCDAYDGNGTLWICETPNFTIALKLERQYGYQYDGEDEDGAIQIELDHDELIAFDSAVTVTLKYSNAQIGADYLGGSVYQSGNVGAFLKDGHFRDMVRGACHDARQSLARMPRVRSVTAAPEPVDARLYNCLPGNAAPDWSRFDSLELHGCMRDENGTEHNLDGDDEEAEYYCIFGHLKTGGLVDITNTPDADIDKAQALFAEISAISGLK